MLVFVPIAIVAEYFLHVNTLIFIASALALIPLAGLLGEATEELAIHTGPKVGGLLNATLGNAAELIITIVALNAGKLDLVKASITRSEERRVGKECRSRWTTGEEEKRGEDSERRR